MKVMIVEDDPISRHLLETFLSDWDYDILAVNDGTEAWETIKESKTQAPSLIISDWMMPNMNGLELCKKIREMEKHDYIYFILLTSKSERKDVIEGLDSGADDFIVKPFDHGELKSRVKIGERIINLESRIMEMANKDFLTGILNRRAFMERMEEEIVRSVREHKIFSLILIDIDHFKTINDSYGHQVGDLVLQKVTGRLSEIIRPYDSLGRYGGEEFVVCSPERNMDQSAIIAERMRRNTEEIKIKLPDNTLFPIQITASFGVACFMEGIDDNTDAIIKRADDALYRAKSEGRNRVCLSEKYLSIKEHENFYGVAHEQSDE